jgi:hypothetical protein
MPKPSARIDWRVIGMSSSCRKKLVRASETVRPHGAAGTGSKEELLPFVGAAGSPADRSRAGELPREDAAGERRLQAATRDAHAHAEAGPGAGRLDRAGLGRRRIHRLRIFA